MFIHLVHQEVVARSSLAPYTSCTHDSSLKKEMWKKIKKIFCLKKLWKRNRVPCEISPIRQTPDSSSTQPDAGYQDAPDDANTAAPENVTRDTRFLLKSTQANLMALTELLLENDENNCAKFLTYNLQKKRRGKRDVCEGSLFSRVQPELYHVPTIKAFSQLFGHYRPMVSEEEELSEEKTKMERHFIETCVNTKVMEIARAYISAMSKGSFEAAKDKAAFAGFLHKMWFDRYARSKRSNGPTSCAFEHVFLGEESGGAVKGFHNWFYFLEQEKKGCVNYYGYDRAVELGDRGCAVKSAFEWLDLVKPTSSFLIGLSPELELAIFTVCAMFCRNSDVQISLAGNPVNVRTHVLFDDNRKPSLATAFVVI